MTRRKNEFLKGNNPMNKTNLIEVVANQTNLKKKDAEAAVNSVLNAIADALAEGEKVQIAGFGTFEVKARGERVGRNPATKEQIVIPASKHPAFSAGKALKEKVNH
jgi:DNA-binding protein HU-beta